jgi:transcriptional regulator with XRE-family HTH domain
VVNQSLTLGEYIRRLRRAEPPRSLLSVSEVAGISYTHLSRIENDSTIPGPEVVVKLAEALGGDLRLMLELADCLPAAILQRIASFDAVNVSGGLKRSSYRADDSEASKDIRHIATGSGLSDSERAEVEEAMKMLCSLQSSTRVHLVKLIQSLYHEGDDATG